MRRLAGVLSGLLLWLATGDARAAVPKQFSVQGVLRDSAGKLQSMMVTVTVQLFDAQTAGNKLAGPFGPTAVMAVNGLFTLTIPDNNVLTELGPAAQVWLEVTVGNDTFARQLVTPELYALMCATADHADQADTLTAACSGCVTNAQIKAGTIAVDRLAQAGAQATADVTAETFFLSGTAIKNVSVATPAGKGAVLVTAGSGFIRVFQHNASTRDTAYCCLGTGGVCSSALSQFAIPAEMPATSASFDLPLSITHIFPINNAAAATFTATLYCTVSSSPSGMAVEISKLQALYIPTN